MDKKLQNQVREAMKPEPKADKPVPCYGCGEPLKPAEVYWDGSGKAWCCVECRRETNR